MMFRAILISFLVVLVAYTGYVGMTHGWNLLPIFFGEIAAFTWSGQFNVDFFMFLLLSGLWVAWRNQFSASSIVLSTMAVLGGMLFLTLYLLYLSSVKGADIKTILVGSER